MTRHRALLAAVTALFFLPHGFAMAGQRSDLATAAQAFEQSALRQKDSDEQPANVIRWQEPIFYAAVNVSGSPAIERSAFAAIQRIGGIAGISVEEIAGSDPRVNVRTILTDNEAPNMPGQAGARTCFSQWRAKAGHIVKVDLNINFANIQRIDCCVIHEAMHGFGFPSHPHAADSVLSYTYQRRDLTPLDELLIRTLYDRRLSPGMKRQIAAKTACGILGELTSTPAADIEAVCAERR